MKFAEKGEVVLSARRVSASRGSTEILFSVRDTGVGVPEDKQQTIFREFEQADQSTTRVHGGTGLGLTISRRLVEMMGGSLQLSSQVGSGSDFHFTLTLPDAVQERAAGRRSSSFSLQGLHVLIVYDNATARRRPREAPAGEGHGSAPSQAGKRNQMNDQARSDACSLVVGVLAERRELDRLIADAAENWRLGRMAIVDRNILRLGAWELAYNPDIPEKVAIDEAIELAKRFGSKESGAFVNGILDRVRQAKQT